MAAYTGMMPGAANNSSIFSNYNKYLTDFYRKPEDTRGDVQSWNQFSGIGDFVKNNAANPAWQGAYNAGMLNLPKNQWGSYLGEHSDSTAASYNAQNPNNPINPKVIPPSNNINTSPSSGGFGGGFVGGGGGASISAPMTSQDNQTNQAPPYQYNPPAMSVNPVNTSPSVNPARIGTYGNPQVNSMGITNNGNSQAIQRQYLANQSPNRHTRLSSYRRFRSK